MTLASTSLAIVRAIKEPSFAVTPTTGNPFVVRLKSESLHYDITKTASAEINNSRTTSSMVATAAKASGAIGVEMRALGLEPFIESVMQDSFVKFGTDGLGAATLTTTVTATAITADAPTTGTSNFANLKKGQWFSVLSDGVNTRSRLRVSTVTAPTASVLTLDPNTPALASTGETLQIQAARLTHGKTQSSWTLEKESDDIGVFMTFRGMTPDKFSLKLATGSLTDGSFDFMGKSAMESNATQLPGTPIAADIFDVHSGVSDSTNTIWMDGVPAVGTHFKSADISFSNKLRAQDAIGPLGAVGVGSGTIECTINVSIYFANKDTFTKYRTNTASSLSLSSVDSDGNGYVFTFPNCNITTWKSDATAKDQDQMVEMTLTALSDVRNADVALQKLLFIDRVGVSA